MSYLKIIILVLVSSLYVNAIAMENQLPGAGEYCCTEKGLGVKDIPQGAEQPIYLAAKSTKERDKNTGNKTKKVISKAIKGAKKIGKGAGQVAKRAGKATVKGAKKAGQSAVEGVKKAGQTAGKVVKRLGKMKNKKSKKSNK